MAAQTQSLSASSNLLQRALLVDGASCIASGGVFTLAASPLASFTGVPDAGLVVAFGLILIAYGVSVFLPGMRGGDLRRVGWWAVIANDVSFLLALFLLVANPLPLTDAGKWLVALLGLLVAVLGTVQFIGLRRVG